MICPKTAKQDKVGGIFPPTRNFACRKMTSGKPAFVVPMVRGGDRLKEKHQKIGVQRHIRIADIEMIEQIERLTKLPGYESANKVINEALFYGMPILYEKLTGGMVTEEEKEEIMIILRQARRMSKLINEMLMIARGEMSESYDMEEVDLILLTEVIVEELREQAEQKKIQISVFSDRDVKMMGNHTLLLRMMMNLVQNAISYGKEHGHIDILWKEQGDMIIGEVKDDGIGIAQEDIPKIWDRFYRVDKSRSRENGGTGLGLSMVHFIVAVHGGKIHVESKKGEGTSFIFQFPKM